MAGPCVPRKTSRGPSSARPGGWARLVATQVRGRGERAVFLGAAALPMFLCQDPGQGESTDEKGGTWALSPPKRWQQGTRPRECLAGPLQGLGWAPVPWSLFSPPEPWGAVFQDASA